ncbi:MAG: hypothetical protein DRP45_08245 [Candidatus Zixiibacteriota bacterium]|nr:MAG: hypothetical protein DRP45_08245 [candidate division Zixibacteria bacterium]
MNQDEQLVPQNADQADQALPTPTIKAGWLRALLFLVALGILTLIQGLVVYFGFDIATEEDFIQLSDKPLGGAVQALILGSTLLLVWLFRIVLDRRSLKSLGFSAGRDKLRDLLIGIGFGIGLMTLVFLVVMSIADLEIVSVQFPFGSLFNLLLFLIMAAAFEEIVLRGYLLKNLMSSMNKYLALVFVSILFAALHGFNPNVSLIGLINIVLAGLLLGIYYVHRQNLWLPIGMHVAWNYFQGPVFGIPVSGTTMPSVLSVNISGNELLTGGDFGFEASLVATAILLAATVLLHFMFRARVVPDVTVPVPSD